MKNYGLISWEMLRVKGVFRGNVVRLSADGWECDCFFLEGVSKKAALAKMRKVSGKRFNTWDEIEKAEEGLLDVVVFQFADVREEVAVDMEEERFLIGDVLGYLPVLGYLAPMSGSRPNTPLEAARGGLEVLHRQVGRGDSESLLEPLRASEGDLEFSELYRRHQRVYLERLLGEYSL